MGKERNENVQDDGLLPRRHFARVVRNENVVRPQSSQVASGWMQRVPGHIRCPMTPESLRAWRNAKNMTQLDLATLCGVTVRQIKRWEKGDYPIPRLLEIYCNEHS